MSDKQCTATGNGCFRKLFLKCKDAIKCRCPDRLAPLVEREFHAVFTFALVLIAKLVYLRWLLSGGPIAENNFLSRYKSYVHIALFLIGGAMLRCLVGYFLKGGHLEQGDTFDYPENGHSTSNKSTERQDRSKSKSKSNKEQTVSPTLDNDSSDPEDDAKFSKDFSDKTPRTSLSK